MLNSRIVSATEAKNKLGEIIGWVVKNGNKVVVENHGLPRVVVISYKNYQTIQMVEEEIKRREALEHLRQLQKEVSERNRDLTPKQAMALADRFVRDVINDMVKEGKIKFEK